jgi:predicted RNase H-like nuclease (RuvC/YqgF family)
MLRGGALKRMREEDACERSAALRALYAEMTRPLPHEEARPVVPPLSENSLAEAVRRRVHELERLELFERARSADSEQECVRLRAQLEERSAHVRTLEAENRERHELRKRNAALEQELFALQRRSTDLEKRLESQAHVLAVEYQRRLERARADAMNEINEHYLALLREPEMQANDIVEHIDAIRTAVGRSLV